MAVYKGETGAEAVIELWPTWGRDIVGRIVGQIEFWVGRLFSAVAALARRLGATEFSISVGGFGVSASVSFSVEALKWEGY